MSKREHPEAYEDDDSRNKKPREVAPPTFKFLAPAGLATAIQFSAHVVESALGGALSVTEPEDTFPGTEQQVVTMQGASWGHLVAGMRLILSMVGNCSECIMPGYDEERRITLIMPSKSVSALIGVKGAHIKDLQQRTGSHIHLDSMAIGTGPHGDRAVNVNGGPAGLDMAIERIVGCIQEFYDQPWYSSWAVKTNAERRELEEAPPVRVGDAIKGGGKDSSGPPLAFRCKGGMQGNRMGGMNNGMMGDGMGCMGGMGGMGGMDAMGHSGGMGGMDGMGGMADMMGGMGTNMEAMCSMMMGNMMGQMMMGGMGGMGMGGTGMDDGVGHGSSGGGGDAASANEEAARRVRPVGACDDAASGQELVEQIMNEMPSFVMKDPRGFVLRSALPGRMCSQLQRKAEAVMGTTGTKITFHGEAGAAARMMSIEGPLMNVCASYMLMMRRYLEVERDIYSMAGGTPR